MTGHRLADAALRCYPTWWRDLYAEEVEQLTDDLLSDGRRELWLAADLFRGALSARVWARAMPPRADLWHARARASIAVATLPFLGVLPFTFFGLQAREGYQTLPRWQVLRLTQAPATQVVHQMWTWLHLGLIAGLIAALVGWSALSRGVRGSRPLKPSRPRLLLKLPLLFLTVLIALFVARQTQNPSSFMILGTTPGVIIPSGGDPVAAAALLDAMWAVLAVGVAVTVIAISRVVGVCDVPWKTIASGRRVAAATTVVLGLMAVWAVIGMAASGPQGLVGRPTGVGPGSLHAPYTVYMVFPHWALMAVPLVIAAVTSFAGWRASRRAATVLKTIDPSISITHMRF